MTNEIRNQIIRMLDEGQRPNYISMILDVDLEVVLDILEEHFGIFGFSGYDRGFQH